jgi:hypothetical protein
MVGVAVGHAISSLALTCCRTSRSGVYLSGGMLDPL